MTEVPSKEAPARDSQREKRLVRPIERAEFDAHRAMVMWLFLATLTLSAFVSAALIYSDATHRQILTILPVVILAGVLGAFVSALNRIYSASDIFPITRYTALLRGASSYLIAYATIPPLVGAISATILYIAFAGQIIESALFPKFACKLDAGCSDFQSFLSSWSPKDATDYAKAIVWGFVAGFSERFVPDILNRIVSDSEKTQSPRASPGKASALNPNKDSNEVASGER